MAEAPDLRRGLPWLAAGLALVLYLATLAPDLLWSDSAKHLIQVAEGDVLGFAHGKHVLHTLLGMLFARLPLALPPSQNLLSAVAGAAAIGLMAAAARRFASPLAALLGALALALSHTFWFYSVINESYALFWALLALALLAALRHRRDGAPASLAQLALASGLAFSTHGLAVLAMPALWLLALAPSPWRAGARGWALALLSAVAATALVWLPDLDGGAASARVELGLLRNSLAEARLYLHPGRLLRQLLGFPLYLGYQFALVGSLALGLGARRLWRGQRTELLLLLGAALPIVLFASSHMPQRQFAMLGAAYLLLAPVLAAGLDVLLEQARARGRGRGLEFAAIAGLLAGEPALYALSSELAGRRSLPIRELPYRNEARYFLWPPKHHATGARRYVEDARRLLPRGATVIADFNPGEALRYAISVERSLDLRLLAVVDDAVLASTDPAPALARWIDEELRRGGPGVYLADRYEPYYRVSKLAEQFELTAVGPFVQVTRLAPP